MRLGAQAAGVFLALAMLLSGPSGVWAQSTDDLRRTIQDMKKQIEMQEQRLKQIEADQTAQQSRVETAEMLMKQLEAQPAQAVLGPAPTPPSAFGVGFFVGIDFQWVGFHGEGTPYAAARFQGGEVAAGKFRTVEVDRDFAPKYYGGFYLPGDWGVVSVDYTTISADGEDQFKTQRLVGVTVIGEFDGTPKDSARAKTNIDLDVFNIQWGFPVQLTKRIVLTPEVGLRAIWFEHKTKADYFVGGAWAIGDTWTTKARAVGPKAGLGVNYTLWDGLQLIFNTSGGYLLGGATARQEHCRSGTFFGATSCDRGHNFNEGGGRGIPFVEGDFGLNYVFGGVLKGLNVSAGYRITQYFDLTTQIKETGGFEPLDATLVRRNVTTDGVYFGAKYIF